MLAAFSVRVSPTLRLDHVPDFRRDIRTAEPRDRANSRRQGHVDLGEMAVDDVDADKQQSALAQRGTQPLTDFALARCDGRLSVPRSVCTAVWCLAEFDSARVTGSRMSHVPAD
jgi:hypothetical protein